MGQIRHGSARTTAAVRRAIQQSQESLAKLAKRYDLNPKTVAKWKKRSHVTDAPMGPKQPHSTVLSAGRRSADGRLSQADLITARRLPVCRASDPAASHALSPPSLPAAARHQPLAGDGR